MSQFSYHDTSKHTSHMAFWGWLLIAFFFCYQYLLRVTPGVIAVELRQAFLLTAEEFASLGSYYLYAYSLLQIPIGFIVDRIGVKRTVLVSLLLCILGTFWLAQTHTLIYAQLSRVLVGLGSASAFMCGLKWVADHFAPGKRGLLMGATLTFGTIGALGAGHPLVMCVEAFGWTQAILMTCLMGVFLWVLIAFFLKGPSPQENPRVSELEHKDGNESSIWQNLKNIASTKTILVYAFLAVGVYTPLAVLADLWGVSFLMEKFSMNRADAASTTMLMYVGLAVGSLFLPPLAERYNAFTRTIQICSLGLLFAFSILLCAPSLSLLTLKALFLVIGILCGAEMICFSGALVGSKPHTSGMTIGFVNTMNMLGGALLQQLIGFILDNQWNGAVDDGGVRIYTATDYSWALLVLPLVLLGCVILSMTLKQNDFKEHRDQHS